ncbi:MAG TPA: DUF4124 domain-containing protein [Burkholderiales bacterium]|nr:DUF4124 domain-containing protein [Burkholderiales bacterium]
MHLSAASYLLALLCGLVFVGSVQSAQPNGRAQSSAPSRIYKWVDEAGVTHYGTSIPPRYAEKAASELNKQGMQVKRIEAAATPEQRKAAEDRAVQLKDEQKRASEQRRRDNALLNTYTSPREIEEAKERNLALPKQAIQGLQPRLQKAQERLASLQGQVDRLKRAGKAVPEHVSEDMNRQQAEIDDVRAEIDRHNAQIEAIRARFDSDRQRYVELTQR